MDFPPTDNLHRLIEITPCLGQLKLIQDCLMHMEWIHCASQIKQRSHQSHRGIIIFLVWTSRWEIWQQPNCATVVEHTKIDPLPCGLCIPIFLTNLERVINLNVALLQIKSVNRNLQKHEPETFGNMIKHHTRWEQSKQIATNKSKKI